MDGPNLVPIESRGGSGLGEYSIESGQPADPVAGAAGPQGEKGVQPRRRKSLAVERDLNGTPGPAGLSAVRGDRAVIRFFWPDSLGFAIRKWPQLDTDRGWHP